MTLPSPPDMFMWVDKRFDNPIRTYCTYPVTKESKVAVKDLAHGTVEYEPGMQIIDKYIPLVELLNHNANYAYLVHANMPHSPVKWQTLQMLDELSKILVQTFEE